jgi:Kef-type K+ transport system membrane component KefB
MASLTFLPQWPFPANPLALFGVLLLAGVAGGELVQRVLRLPRITGYVLIGMLLGASGLRLLDDTLIEEAWIFVDIALGLVLFELGRRLDLGWFRRDPWLAAAGVAESALAFVCVYFALVAFDVQPLYAAVAAAIGVSTSPAVVMLVAQELKAEGQVTERALHLTALNSVIAFTLVTMLLSGIHQEYRAGWLTAALHPVYLLGGSLLLGYAASLLALALSRWLGRRAELHYVILLGLVIAAVGAARMLELSVLLALLAFGVLVRHLDERHDLDPVDLGRVGQLFFVVLFVVAGAKLVLPELVTGGTLALVYVLARFVGKALGVMSFTYFSGLRPGTAGLLTIALTPMSGLALAMVQGTTNLYPEFGAKLAAIVLSAVLILELLGPLAVQFALKRAGEAEEKHG